MVRPRVEIRRRTVPAVRVGVIVRFGPWRPENLRSEFRELTRWARRRGLRTGRWIFGEPAPDRWEACLEVRGAARSEGRIRVRTLPGARAWSVPFDPDRVASRVVYHALAGWVREHGAPSSRQRPAGIREVYPGDPWGDRTAWSRCEVQFLERAPKAGAKRGRVRRAG